MKRWTWACNKWKKLIPKFIEIPDQTNPHSIFYKILINPPQKVKKKKNEEFWWQ